MITTEAEVMLIPTWPALKAVKKQTGSRSWKPFPPLFRLPRPKTDTLSPSDEAIGPDNVSSSAVDPRFEKHLAFYLFRSAIPPELVRSIEKFTNRQWMLLAVCKRRERFRDLLDQNPALGFGVAHVAKFNPLVWDPFDTAVKISALRQRDMLKWIGLPTTQSWVNILGKVTVSAITCDRLKLLGYIAAIPGCEKHMQHLPCINAGVIEMVADPRFRGILSAPLLEEIAGANGEGEDAEAGHLMDDIILLSARMRLPAIQTAFRSLAALRARQQELIGELEQFLKREKERATKFNIFPPPPLSGTAEIVPLTTADELWAEGLAQHNCVGGYAPRVHKDELYIYRILKPERATLSIHKKADGNWSIDQLLLACNRSVLPATRKRVQEWLDQFTLSV